MRKILVINTTLNKGGAARIAADLFRHKYPDLEMHFAFGRGHALAEKNTFYFGNKLELLLHLFLVRFLGLEGFGSFFATRKLIRFIRKEKFDLIHLHNLHGYYLNFFTLIKFIKKQNLPVVWTLHDEWPITWLPAHSLGCLHCKTGQGKCTNTYAYPKNFFSLFTKFMLRKKGQVFSSGWKPVIVCPSVWLQQNIADSFLSGHDIRVISNGIDTNLFKPATDKKALRVKYGLPADKKIIVFSASNLKDKSKGIDNILRIAEILADKDYLFLGIGAGKIEHTKNFITTGYIHDKKKFAEIYALADLYCFATTAETFLLSAIEALSCGIPVAGFGIPVINEVINDRVGLLTPPDDDRSLASAIVHLLENDQERHEKSKNGREMVLNSYSDELFAKKYSNLYHEILK